MWVGWFGLRCTSHWHGSTGWDPWKGLKPSSDSPTENVWEAMSVHNPWRRVRWKKSNVTVHRLMSMSGGLIFVLLFFFNPAQKNLLYWKPDCVSYRHRTPVGAKFLPYKAFSYNTRNVSQLSIAASSHTFHTIICWRCLSLKDPARKQPAKDAALA